MTIYQGENEFYQGENGFPESAVAPKLGGLNLRAAWWR